MHTTPPSLLERLRQPHDDEAWARFVRLYTPLLLRWTHRLGLPAAEANDLVQEVFLLLVRKLPEFRYDRDRSFRAWLWTLARNRWCDLGSRRSVRSDGGHVLLAAVAQPDPAEGIDAEEHRAYLSQRALQLIQREFQPATWKAFWEVVVEDRPAAEVATELGLTVNAVYLARCRVLRRLREELDGLLD